MLKRVTDDGVQTRAHLETQLASAMALKSPNEYRQCLLSYIRFLARSGILNIVSGLNSCSFLLISFMKLERSLFSIFLNSSVTEKDPFVNY